MTPSVLKKVKASAAIAAGALTLGVLGAAPAIAGGSPSQAPNASVTTDGEHRDYYGEEDYYDSDRDHRDNRDHGDRDRDHRDRDRDHRDHGDRDRDRDHRDHDRGDRDRDRDHRDHDRDRDRNRDHRDRDHHGHDRGKVIAKHGVNVRKDPTTSSKIVGGFNHGKIVKIKCKVRGQSIDGNRIWYKVEDDDKKKDKKDKKDNRRHDRRDRRHHNDEGWVTARWVKNLDRISWCGGK